SAPHRSGHPRRTLRLREHTLIGIPTTPRCFRATFVVKYPIPQNTVETVCCELYSDRYVAPLSIPHLPVANILDSVVVILPDFAADGMGVSGDIRQAVIFVPKIREHVIGGREVVQVDVRG